MPLLCEAAVTSAKLLHPEFEHVLFTRQKIQFFIENEFPEYKEFLSQFEKQYEQLVYQERSQNLNAAALLKEWKALTKRRKHA